MGIEKTLWNLFNISLIPSGNSSGISMSSLIEPSNFSFEYNKYPSHELPFKLFNSLDDNGLLSIQE